MFLLLLATPAPAQEEEENLGRDTDFTVSLGHVNGQPGTEIKMPVLFGRKPGTPNVTKVRARVSYPASILKFLRIENAYLSQRVKLAAAGTESRGSGDESVLDLSFELPDPQNTNFPSGQIATITFSIAAEAPDQVVPISPDAWIDEVQVMADSTTAQVQAGQVRISEVPIFVGCFFFTH